MKKLLLCVAMLATVHISAQSSKNYDPILPNYSTQGPVNPIPTTSLPPPPPSPIPVDGGAGILLVSGIGYGLRLLAKNNKGKRI